MRVARYGTVGEWEEIGTPTGGPGAGPCPASSPVVCHDRCCPAASTCTADGCAAAPLACPPEAPTICTDATYLSASVGFDSSMYQNALTLGTPLDMPPGRFGSGLQLTPPSGSCTAPFHAGVAGQPFVRATVSFEAWIKMSASGAVFSVGTQSNTNVGSLIVDGTTLHWATATTDCQVTAPASVTDGAWHFVAVAPDEAASSKVALYADGAKAGSCPGKLALGVPGAQLQLGVASTSSGCSAMSGVIDEIRLLSVGLTSAQVALDAAGGPFFTTPDTGALWHLDNAASQRCCPARKSCNPDGSCGLPPADDTPQLCPPTGPSVCNDGSCCPLGTTCSAVVVGGQLMNECVQEASVCPATVPTNCGNGNCCPVGAICSMRHGQAGCDLAIPGGLPNAPACGARETPVTANVCCPQPLQGHSDKLVNTSHGSYCEAFDPEQPRSPCSPESGCDPGYSCDAGATVETFPACVTASTQPACASGASTCGGGCCAAGDSCTGNRCCPPSNPTCACPVGSVRDGSACVVPSTPVACAATDTLCGGNCCAAGFSCETVGSCPPGGTCTKACLKGPQLAPACAAGENACGSTCCPAGSTCGLNRGSPGWAPCVVPPTAVACDEDHPIVCGNGGVCCPADQACVETAGKWGCAITGEFPMPGGANAVPCDGGGFCRADEACAANDTCCPPTLPVPCLGGCCALGHACGPAGCECLEGWTRCEGVCCAPGSPCIAGECASGCLDPAAPTTCGSLCCEADLACDSALTSQCACPADHPVACGTVCCLGGGQCEANPGGPCLCPGGDAPCGGQCCGGDQQCTGGVCVCTNGHPACGSACCDSDEACVSGACVSTHCEGGRQGSLRLCMQDATSGNCVCTVRSTSLCITPAIWAEFSASPVPAPAMMGESCVGPDGVTLTRACAPGLVCLGVGGPACGVGEGTCQ